MKKWLTFFYLYPEKGGIGTIPFLYFTAIYFFFLSTPPKRKWLLLYPDEESESKNITRTKTIKALRVGGYALVIFC